MTPDFAEYAAYEKKWLDTFVEAGYFNRLFVDLLAEEHTWIAENPNDYRLSLIEFMRQTGMSQPLPQGIKLKEPHIFVARLVVSRPETGVGFNLVVAPEDPLQQSVRKELYPKSQKRLGIEDLKMPFGVLFADAYYFQGSAYRRGSMEGDIHDSGYELFNDFDLTWNYLHYPEVTTIFKLGSPYIPS